MRPESLPKFSSNVCTHSEMTGVKRFVSLEWMEMKSVLTVKTEKCTTQRIELSD